MGGWNGTGGVELTYNWTEDAANEVDIEADRMDAQFEDLRGAVEESINRNGENSPSVDLPMGGFKHTGVDDADARDQYASLGQLQDSGALWAGTSSGTNTITLSLSPAPTVNVKAGRVFRFIAGGTNTGSATINLNGLGARNLRTVTGAVLPAGFITNGTLYEAIDDGTNIRIFQFGTVLGLGYSSPSYNAGTVTTGTFTPAALNGNIQHYINGGAHTLAPPATVTVITLEITNNGSAGAITTSGFDNVDGSFTTTNGDRFICDLRRTNTAKQLIIRKV